MFSAKAPYCLQNRPKLPVFPFIRQLGVRRFRTPSRRNRDPKRMVANLARIRAFGQFCPPKVELETNPDRYPLGTPPGSILPPRELFPVFRTWRRGDRFALHDDSVGCRSADRNRRCIWRLCCRNPAASLRGAESCCRHFGPYGIETGPSASCSGGIAVRGCIRAD
jgi:hypothetical protein